MLPSGERYLRHPFVWLCVGRLPSSLESDEMAVEMGCVSCDRMFYVHCAGDFLVDMGDGTNHLLDPGNVAGEWWVICFCRDFVVFCVTATALLISVSAIPLSRVLVCFVGRVQTVEREH